MNAVLVDIGSELTNSVAKDGQTSMSGQFKASGGTLAAPGYTYGSDLSTGIRRSASGTQRIVSSGVDVVEVSATGLTMVAGTITDANSYVVVGMPTGVILPYGATSAPTGWVRANARTIGNASSAATERANADTENLFTFLWTNYSDSVCAVSTGRGASAAADYAANKTIGLPDLRGRGLFGLDDMGNSAASRLGTVVTSSTTNGASGGTETHTLTQAQLPSATLAVTIVDPGHLHSVPNVPQSAQAVASGAGTNVATGSFSSGLTTGSAATGITATAALGGSNTAHSNMPPAFLTTFIIKL